MQPTCWNYTKEEWRDFLRWKTKKKGLWFLLLQHLRPVKTQHVPEIKISSHTVSVNNSHERFHNDQRRFKEIHIREAGNINIMEIRYVQANKIHGISLPIPKGKLREAFEVQERLDNVNIRG
jgi:hypothetical protein